MVHLSIKYCWIIIIGCINVIINLTLKLVRVRVTIITLYTAGQRIQDV